MDYIELIEYRKAYELADQETIKANIKRLMNVNNIKHDKLCALLNISLHTAYSYTNKANNNKPELYNLIILASFFEISVLDMFSVWNALE